MIRPISVPGRFYRSSKGSVLLETLWIADNQVPVSSVGEMSFCVIPIVGTLTAVYYSAIIGVAVDRFILFVVRPEESGIVLLNRDSDRIPRFLRRG